MVAGIERPPLFKISESAPVNNGSYQLLKKDPTTKIKAKTLKQWKALKDNEFIDNKRYYYLKPTDSPELDFNVNQK